MKKLILVLSLVLISVCLLTSCNNQENDIDTDIKKAGYIENIEDITVNFKCRVVINEENSFYIQGDEAINLYELAFNEYNTGQRFSRVNYDELDSIQLEFMSDVVDEEKDCLTWKDDSEEKYWYGELVYYSNDTAYYSVHPLFSYAETRQLDKGDFLLIQNYINSIK